MNNTLPDLNAKYHILVTGGAGFIGSNLCETLLNNGNRVTCLDNFATGKRENIEHLHTNTKFTLIEGDIRNLADCQKACKGVDYILHQAALGSVPRSINDPITSNEVNVSGFLNMLVAARGAKVKRFSKTYGLETIGLRYFNVFGRKQDPNGAYAAVIPKFVMQLMKYESPVINGDGTYSRDFTYIDNVIQMNLRAIISNNKEALDTVYNVAYGERTDLNELVGLLKEYLSVYDPKITEVPIIHGPNRQGDVPHSLASVDKAKKLLGYDPRYDIKSGLKQAVQWYWSHLK